MIATAVSQSARDWTNWTGVAGVGCVGIGLCAGADVAEAERVIKEYKDEYWIVGVTVTTIFETAWALRGYDQTLMDFALNPDLIERLFDIPFRYHLTAAKKLVELGVDMIWVGDEIWGVNCFFFAVAEDKECT